jgi:hypothetical protein
MSVIEIWPSSGTPRRARPTCVQRHRPAGSSYREPVGLGNVPARARFPGFPPFRGEGDNVRGLLGGLGDLLDASEIALDVECGHAAHARGGDRLAVDVVGYVAGSLVMVLTTYQSVERRALKNLFGILPRHTVVVHRLPEWLEWTLAIIAGYLVMEFVRHIIKSNKYLRLIDGPARDKARAQAGPASH